MNRSQTLSAFPDVFYRTLSNNKQLVFLITTRSKGTAAAEEEEEVCQVMKRRHSGRQMSAEKDGLPCCLLSKIPKTFVDVNSLNSMEAKHAGKKSSLAFVICCIIFKPYSSIKAGVVVFFYFFF